jgi:hypothetical protein
MRPRDHELAALYREWVDNRRALEAVLAEMRDLSREAGAQDHVKE